MHDFATFLALSVPGVVWLVSYALLASEFKTWRLLQAPIHESGKYSLLQTVFYYDHFLRELPIDTFYASAILWSYSAAGVLPLPGLPANTRAIAVAGLGLFLVLVFVGSARKVGWPATLENLFQHRETDIRHGWGTHWQMHFLSTAGIVALFLLPGLFLPMGSGGSGSLVPMLASFAVLSIVFRTGTRALRDPRWILHGGREMLTYLVLVFIPALAPLINPVTTGRLQVDITGVAAVILLSVATLYMLWVFRHNRLDDLAASDRGFVYLISSHFFEHALDVCYIFLLVLAFGA